MPRADRSPAWAGDEQRPPSGPGGPDEQRPARGGPDERAQAVAGLADAVATMLRAATRAKAQVVAADRHSASDWWAYPLLSRLLHDGPQRVGALAGLTHCDASTVSRQVGSLVKDGLVERQPDPEDGRASRLVLTERGRMAHRDFQRRRDEHFDSALAAWTTADLRRFSGLLHQFADDLQRSLPPASDPAAPADAAPLPGAQPRPPAREEQFSS